MGLFSKKPKLTPQDTLNSLPTIILLTTLAVHEQIIEVWPKTTDTKLTIEIDWLIHTEILFLFLIMTDRYAFGIGGPIFRDNLQDAIVSQSISSIMTSSFNSSHVKKGFDKEAWHEKMVSGLLGDYNEAEVDYGSCKELMNKASAFNEETIMGKFAARIIRADEHKVNPTLTLVIFTAAIQALDQAQLKQKVEEVYRNHQELH